MLIYVDGAKAINVFRPNESGDGAKRIALGMIDKRTYDFRPVDGAVVTADETAEMERITQSYKAADAAKLRAQALSFPEIARQVAHYFATQATDVEKHLISVAAQEMLRAIRKAERAKDAPQS